MDIKLITTTSRRDYEQEIGILLKEGYKPLGDLRLERLIGEWYLDGANHWQRKQEIRYIREMVKE